MRKMRGGVLVEVVVAVFLLIAGATMPWNALPMAVLAQSGGSSTLPMTQLTDTVYRADGTTATGTVLVSWPSVHDREWPCGYRRGTRPSRSRPEGC